MRDHSDEQPPGIEDVVREHYGMVVRFCARRIGPDLAEDAAQETFVTYQKTLKNRKGDSSLKTWLLGIAMNHCRNLSRKHRQEIHLMDAFEPPPVPSHEGTVVDQQELYRALGRLSLEHREVVVLHEVEELTYDEIASLLNIPAGTVKSRLHHAFLNLRRQLIPSEVQP